MLASTSEPEILQLCQEYAGFLVETQQQAQLLPYTLFERTILENAGQPENTYKTTNQQVYHNTHRIIAH